MKRNLFCAALALGAAALLGAAASRARADSPPAALPKGPAGDAAAVAPAAPAAPAVVSAPVPAACCPAPACEAPIKKVCVGEKAIREKTTRVYGEACEDFCVPKCSLFGHLKLFGHSHGDCADGGCTEEGCTSCEHHVRQRKYLVVRIKKEDECYNKCHVEYQLDEPKCKAPCYTDSGCTGVIVAPPTAPPVEKIPAPKGK